MVDLHCSVGALASYPAFCLITKGNQGGMGQYFCDLFKISECFLRLNISAHCLTSCHMVIFVVDGLWHFVSVLAQMINYYYFVINGQPVEKENLVPSNNYFGPIRNQCDQEEIHVE